LLAAETQLKALMMAALAGDGVAYRGLLAAVGLLLRRYFARRLGNHDPASAEDLVQETLIAIHTRRATYDTAQPFTAWLYAIARYKLADHFRRRRVRATVPLEDAGELFEMQDAETLMARRDLDRLLETLPEASQLIIRKVKIEGMSTAEAAAQTGRSEVAVRVGLHRGLKSLSDKVRDWRGGKGE
jgi:RNA polymerase sigma-70 factor (ECF subfamily)